MTISSRIMAVILACSTVLMTFAPAMTAEVPSISASIPLNGAMGVQVGTEVRATFNVAMNATAINSSNVTLSSFVGIKKIAGGYAHTIALKNNGAGIGWGDNSFAQASVPTALTNLLDVVAGESHSVALKNAGTVVAWGRNDYGQTTVPANLSGVTAIAAGFGHTVALKNNGTVIAWGLNAAGQRSVPANLTGVIAIAAGGFHTLALKSNGTVVAWGRNDNGQISVPANLTGVVAISAGWLHSLALKDDGTVVAWGGKGISAPPLDLVKVKAIAAGGYHSLALKEDGSVVAWGSNRYGQAMVPPSALIQVKAISAGFDASFAVKDDGTVVLWGRNQRQQITVKESIYGIPITSAVSYDANTRTVSIAPSLPFPSATKITASVSKSVASVEGASAEKDLAWSFTTASSAAETSNNNNGVIVGGSCVSVDTDGDGIGNSVDLDDDGDGIVDIVELANGTDPLDSDISPPGAPIVTGVACINSKRPIWSWTTGGSGNGTFRYHEETDNFTGSYTTTTTLSVAAIADLPDGTYTIYVQERDAAGNWSRSGKYTTIVDTLSPTLNVSTLNNQTTNNATRNIAGTVSDSNGIVNVTVNGIATTVTNGLFSYPFVLSSGSNTITIVATDLAGNSATATHTVILDQDGPMLTVTAPVDNSATTTNQLTITGSCGDAVSVTITVNSEFSQSASITEGTYILSLPLNEGQNTVAITATDALGNNTTVARTIIYDATAPTVAITTPAADTMIRMTPYTISGTVEDALSDVVLTMTLNGQNVTPIISGKNFSFQLDFPHGGVYQLVVTAKDLLENTSTVARNLIYAPSWGAGGKKGR